MKGKKGLLVSFEGIDGAGKTTLIKALEKSFPDQEILVLREPGGARLSEKIRELLLDTANRDMLERTEAFLYASARSQVVGECLRPALQAGKIVFLDRYIDSTIAYQGYGRGLDISFLTSLNDLASDQLMPDITFLLDLEPQVAQRRQGEKIADRLESEGREFTIRVRNGYLEIARQNPERIVVLDGKCPVEKLSALAAKEIIRRFMS